MLIMPIMRSKLQIFLVILIPFFGSQAFSEADEPDEASTDNSTTKITDIFGDEEFDDPYMPADAIGKFIYKIERYFGMDKATKIAKFQRSCDLGYGEFCLKLAEMARQDKNTFGAENYYYLSCRYGNTGACKFHDKLLTQRLKFEKDLSEKKKDYSKDCSEGEVGACASLSFVEQYFGNYRAAREMDEKACEMGYPASCLSVHKVEFENGNYIEAEKYKRKAQKLFGLKEVVLEKLNGPSLPSVSH